MEELKEQVLEAARAYNIACSIDCRVIDPMGKIEGLFRCDTASAFCRLVTETESLAEICRNSNLYGGYHAEKLGHYYIYFCPFGLANWAVPVYGGGLTRYYVIGGPVLLHEVDNLLLNQIRDLYPKLDYTREQLRKVLKNIPAVSPTRVRYLATVLLSLVKVLMPKDSHLLEGRHRFHLISGEIAASRSKEELLVFEKEKQLIAKVKMGDLEGSRETLNKILGHIYFNDSSDEIKKGWLISLMAVLVRASIDAGADLEIVFGLEYKYLSKMEETDDLMELSALLVRILERFFECAFLLKNVKNRDLIYRAIHYIRNHYADGISLEDVAREVDLHPSYFSKLFREEMQMTYSDYLNTVRIDASAILIREGYPLAQVAQMVGFNDQSYFSKVFKRIKDISPGKWRSSQVG